MNVDKLQADRARRPPPPRLSAPGATSPNFPGALNLDFVLAMDERVREVVKILRERNSVLILNPDKLEAQEEEASAELYAALQEVSRCRAYEEEANRIFERSQDEAYNRTREEGQRALDQWKVWDSWSKRRGAEWEPIKTWEKHREAYDRKQASMGLKSTTETQLAAIKKWMHENPLTAKPPEPREPPRPASLPEPEVKVTDLRKTASVDPSVDRYRQALIRAREERHQAEDYSTALQQKLALISGLQGARNHGL